MFNLQSISINETIIPLSNEDISIIIQSVCNIAKKAGDAILDVYNSDDLGIASKSDDSPLTKADQAANDIIVAELQKLTPNIPIISEEMKNVDYTVRSLYEYFWMVDPLDGTKEFIKRNGEFTVNIALIHHQRSIAGVVYIPVSDICYSAVQGQGSFKNHDGITTKIESTLCSMDQSNIRVVCSRSHLNEATQEIIDALNEPLLVSIGSSLKFTIIAEGEAELYPRMAPTMEWDTAAAQIILEEAGGSVIDQSTMQPVRYNKENLLNPYFIAYANIKKD